MEKLVKKIKIQTSITLLTGLHIGGSSDNVVSTTLSSSWPQEVMSLISLAVH